jgi:hypothetical protein
VELSIPPLPPPSGTLASCDGTLAGIAPAPVFFSIWPPLAGSLHAGSAIRWLTPRPWSQRILAGSLLVASAELEALPAARARRQDPACPLEAEAKMPPKTRVEARRWGAALAESRRRGRSGPVRVAGRSRPTLSGSRFSPSLWGASATWRGGRGPSLTPSWGKPGPGLGPAAGVQFGRAMAPCCHGTRAHGYVRVHQAGGGGGLWLAASESIVATALASSAGRDLLSCCRDEHAPG